MKHFFRIWINACRQELGAISVEYAFYFVIFVMLCGLLLDFSLVFTNKHRLERINNSLALVLRERTIFYEKREQLSQADVTQLKQLADKLLPQNHISNDYRLVVDAWYFKKFNDNSTKKQIDIMQTFSSGSTNCTVTTSTTEQEAIFALSPWSDHPLVGNGSPRWLPVYRVTLCLPGAESWFMRALGLISGNKRLGTMMIKNSVVPR